MDAINNNILLEDTILHILPTFLRVEEEMISALAGSECGVIFGKKIFTFPQLIARIYEEIRSDKICLSPPAQLVLIERVVEAVYKDKEDGFFAPLVNSKTLCKTLSNIINTMKSYNIKYDDINRMIEKLHDEDRIKFKELATIYRSYQMRLEELGLIDHSDLCEEVKNFVKDKDSEISFLKGINSLKVEDIYDFTPVQFDLIIALACRLPHTLVVFPYDHDRDDIFAYVERTIKRFESLWELNVDVNLDFKPQRDASQGKLSEVMRNYFRRGNETESEPVRIENEVALIESTGIYQETEEIGREIRRLLDAGVKPGSIGVLFRDLSVYGEMIEDVFHRFKIPIYFRRGRPLLSNNLVKTILSIFELLNNNFKRDTFLKIMRSNYVGFWGDDDSLPAEKMESYILRAGIIDDRGNSWEHRLDRLIERIDKKINSPGESCTISRAREEREEVARLKDRIGYVKSKIELLKKKNTIAGFTGILRELLQYLKVPYRIMCCEDEEILKRDIAAMEKFEGILEEMDVTAERLALRDETVARSYFHRLLLKFMEESFILSGRESSHGVKVLNLYESRGLAFEYLFIGGLMEDSFPGKMWQDPIFRDDEKAQFNHLAGKKIFLLMEEKWEEEPLLFYLGMSCARRKLYLSFSRLDAKGRDVLPSLYLNEVIRLVDKKDSVTSRVSQGLVVPRLEDCFEAEEIENRLAYAIWRPSFKDGEAEAHGENSARILTAAVFNKLADQEHFRRNFGKIFQCAEIEKKREQFYLEEIMVTRKSKASVWTGLITDEEIKRELKTFFEKGEGRFWSPTHFEHYVSCPFRFFLERVLKVFPLKVPDEELEMVDEGTLVHRVLERFFKIMKEDGLFPIVGSEKEKTLIKRVAEEIYQKWEAEEYTGNRDLWEIRKKRLSPRWERFVEEEAGYAEKECQPAYFEFLIGHSSGDESRSDMPALVIKDFNSDEILVGGKIDRVDSGPEKIRVIDYKNSSSESVYRDLLKKEKIGVISFQIPVYLAAVKEFMAEQKKMVNSMEGTFYLFKKTKRMKPYTVEESDPFYEKDLIKREKLKEQREMNLFNQISEIVRGAKNGDYTVCPDECTFCAYAHICRFVSIDIDEGEV